MNNEDVPKKKKRKKLKIVLLCIGGLVGIVFIACVVDFIKFTIKNPYEPPDKTITANQSIDELEPSRVELEQQEIEPEPNPTERNLEDIDQVIKSNDVEKLKIMLSASSLDSAKQISGAVNQHYMNLLAANRSRLYMCDLTWLNQLQENLDFTQSPNFDQTQKIYQIKEKLNYVASLTPDNQEYNKLLASTQNVVELNVDVLSRVLNSEYIEIGGRGINEGYLDEYSIVGAYFDDENKEAILRTSEKIQQGYLSTYAKISGTSDYVSGNGFEETLDVFTKLDDAEVQQYFIDLQRMEELVGKTSDLNEVIGDLIIMVNEYAAQNPPPITDANYLGVYVNANSEMSAEFIERIELKSDGTFILHVNYAEYFMALGGTYKKEGSVFMMKPFPGNNDPDFTFELSNGALIYHGEQLGWIKGESQFIK